MLLGSHGASQWERGAFVPAGQIRCVHSEDPPALHWLAEKTQLECINEGSIISARLDISLILLLHLPPRESLRIGGAPLKLLGPLDSPALFPPPSPSPSCPFCNFSDS